MELTFYSFYKYIIFLLVSIFLLSRSNLLVEKKDIIKISIITVVLIIIIDGVLYTLKKESGITDDNTKLAFKISVDTSDTNIQDEHDTTTDTDDTNSMIDEILETQNL